MVLHNSKWDRRAKSRYLKKHGLTPAAAATGAGAAADSAGDHTAESPDALSDTEPQTVEISNEEGTAEVAGLFPEFEEDDEEAELIRRHIAQQALKYKKEQAAAQTVDNSVFERAQAGVERSILNQRVRKIAAKAPRAPVELDSDSDFEEFMDNVDPTPENHSRNKIQQPVRPITGGEKTHDNAIASKNSFLDELLR